MLSVWFAGFAPPAVALKLKLVGLTPIVGEGGAAFTVSVTGTLTGVLVAPVAETVIVPLYVPAARPEMLTESVLLEGAVPVVGLRVSHVASSLRL